jgi:16S rRNA (uracil1498-N3)-methyltransferase
LPNFFIKKAQIEKNQIRITGELLKHLRDSLRIQKGEKFVCVDEDANRYTVEVSSVSKALLIGDVIEKTDIEKIPAVYIHLVQAIPKGPKLDFIIQKSTELGVNAITPVISERSVVRIEKERVHDKSERWRRIALEAAQQSNRLNVPDVAPPVTLRDFLSSYKKADLNLLLWEGEQRSGIRDLLHRVQDVKNITLLIGPEGGFSGSEVRMAIEKGFIPVSLGELILRTETAPIVVLSILQYEFGSTG